MTPAQWIERILLVWFGLILGLALSFQVFSGSRVYVTFKQMEVKDECMDSKR